MPLARGENGKRKIENDDATPNGVKRVKCTQLPIEPVPSLSDKTAARVPIVVKTVKSPEAPSMKFLIGQKTVDRFMEVNWSMLPFGVIHRPNDYFRDNLVSEKSLTYLFAKTGVKYEDIDIEFKEGQEPVTKPIGRVSLSAFRKLYREGCGVRILNPEKFFPAIHSTIDVAQQVFQSQVESTLYYGRELSKGYAPRVDNAEIFILQIGGSRLYTLSRPVPQYGRGHFEYVSPYLAIRRIELLPGNSLYIPKGWTHESQAMGDGSFHLTLSVNQKQTYGDLMDFLIPMALDEAAKTNVELRKGLPLDIWDAMGEVNVDKENNGQRVIINKQIENCLEIIERFVSEEFMDKAVDRMAIRNQSEMLPPMLTADERSRSVNRQNNLIRMDTNLRLIRENIVRMTQHDTWMRVHYISAGRSKSCHAVSQFFDIDPWKAEAIEFFIKSYPEYVTPGDLPLATDEMKSSVAHDLWEKGLLVSDAPLH